MINNIKCLDYESEATEDRVCAGMISFKMPVVGREKKSPKVYICNEEAVSLRSICSFIRSPNRSNRHKSHSSVRNNVDKAES